MLTVVFNEEVWYLDITLRATLFQDYKKANPHEIVLIQDKQGNTKSVCLCLLEDYSIWRNVIALFGR